MTNDDSDVAPWDGVALEYHRHISGDDILRTELRDKPTLKLLGDVRGKKILDAGCGQGYFSAVLADLGAHVTGIDGSEKLIEIAKEKFPENNRLSFLRLNLKNTLPFKKGGFDIIVCNMVLMDLDPICLAINEFGKVLKPNGIFVFSIIHPFISPSKLRKNIFEKIFWQIPHYEFKRYHSPSKQKWTVLGLSKPTFRYHRPLEYYTSLLHQASFQILEIKEPVLEKTLTKHKNNFLKLSSEVPLFLMVKSTKAVPGSRARLI